MWRTIMFRRTLVSPAAIILLLATTLGSYLLISHAAATAHPYVAIPGSAPSVPQNARLSGQLSSTDQLTISVVLHPNNEAQMNALLAGLYDVSSPAYHHWLGTGQFNARFAPTAAQIAQVRSFLTQAGLRTIDTSTPFLVRAVGTVAQIEAAFHTHLSTYTAANGRHFFQNDSPVQVPANLGSLVLAVTGLTNTINLHPSYLTTNQAAVAPATTGPPPYGGGPGGSGLTPSQINSLYGNNEVQKLGARGKGKGATLALFELTGYTSSDIAVYEHRFFGPSENVSLVDINVDGGPVNPACPTGDFCGPVNPNDPTHCPPPLFACDSADYSGDIEAEIDIETQISIAPKIDHILVYNAPNDFLGITTLDELFQIAQDNRADSISTSWGLCEQDTGLEQIQAESLAFAQMAAQGQSMFSQSGDTGAFDCIRGSGATMVAVGDPSSQPFVTGVGGTSFSVFDPQADQHPGYPTGLETVWNPLNECRDNSQRHLDFCATLGAGGGGVSAIWGQPGYQHGPGVTNSFSLQGPSNCALARLGQFCREVPDISANADEFTPYTEFCTGDPKTNSTCVTVPVTPSAPGWFGIGGTSVSSPLWSAIIGLWDSVHGQRFGAANHELYALFRSHDAYSRFFHDISGIHQTIINNGTFPTTPNYDMATGIGSPRIDGVVLSNP